MIKKEDINKRIKLKKKEITHDRDFVVLYKEIV